MNHRQYIRLSENKKTVVLLIHGILGSPRFFDGLIDIIPEEWSVYNILLDGHGKGVSDFSHTSMKKWRNQVVETLEEFEGEYENVVVVGHSMGSLLSIEASLKKPGNIRRMIFFAVPVKVLWKPSMFAIVLRVILGRNSKNKAIAETEKTVFSIESDKSLIHHIGWIPRSIELLALIRTVRRSIGKVKIQTHAFQSGCDEMVSPTALRYLKKNTAFDIDVLEKSRHYWYDDEEYSYAKEKIRTVFENMK
ncbi:MAG: alpha/beta fold hydrolase [Clostridia bacterium]|nr:alpha/beta fold hydrolase [Oscillospiraceae bacterium]MBQ7960460.1 alpha/beta fold hydrolase [Clostridia bacterium]